MKKLRKPEKIWANLGDGFPRGHSRNIRILDLSTSISLLSVAFSALSVVFSALRRSFCSLSFVQKRISSLERLLHFSSTLSIKLCDAVSHPVVPIIVFTAGSMEKAAERIFGFVVEWARKHYWSFSFPSQCFDHLSRLLFASIFHHQDLNQLTVLLSNPAQLERIHVTYAWTIGSTSPFMILFWADYIREKEKSAISVDPCYVTLDIIKRSNSVWFDHFAVHK